MSYILPESALVEGLDVYNYKRKYTIQNNNNKIKDLSSI